MKPASLLLLLLLTACSKQVVEYSPEPEVYFNPELPEKLFLILSGAEKSIECAFYDLNIEEIIKVLDEKSKKTRVRLVMDDDNALNRNYVRVDGKGLMHNKFCVIDDVMVWTGSFNPTGNQNDENMLVLFSKSISNVYSQEFEEMWAGKFKGGKRSKDNVVILNNATYKIYFCPEDMCEEKALGELEGARKSIYFMTFSFTSKSVADRLLTKSYSGVDVKGVWEERRINMDYEKYSYLVENGIEIKEDDNKYIMHHKVFIIDNKTLITGSYNPTNNANKNNDENLIITDDPLVVQKYLEEFGRLYKE